MVTGPRTIELQWSRPLTPNGLVTSYSLHYTDVNQSLKGNTFNYTAQNLNEFTNYTFTLSASTSAGTGPSTTVNARTEEDGEQQIANIRMRQLHLPPSISSQHYLSLTIEACYLSLSLSVCLSVCLSVYLFISVCLYVCLCLSACLCFCILPIVCLVLFV